VRHDQGGTTSAKQPPCTGLVGAVRAVAVVVVDSRKVDRPLAIEARELAIDRRVRGDLWTGPVYVYHGATIDQRFAARPTGRTETPTYVTFGCRE